MNTQSEVTINDCFELFQELYGYTSKIIVNKSCEVYLYDDEGELVEWFMNFEQLYKFLVNKKINDTRMKEFIDNLEYGYTSSEIFELFKLFVNKISDDSTSFQISAFELRDMIKLLEERYEYE